MEHPLRATPTALGGARVPPVVWLPLLLLAAAAVLLIRLDGTAAIDPAEAHSLRASRAIVETGDWITPRIEDSRRLPSPPLYAWMGAATGRALGGLDELALRLPSVAAALGMLLLAFAWGRSLRGDMFGMLCAVVLASMVLLYAQGRRGEAETTLALTAGIALFAFDRIHYAGSARRPAFAAALALAFLAKGATGLAIVGLPIVATRVSEGRLLRALRPATLGWLLVALLPGIAWYVAGLAIAPHGAGSVAPVAWTPGHGTRPAGAGGSLAPWSLLLALPSATAPAALLLPAVAWRAWTTHLWRDQPRMRFVGLCFLGVFLAFSLLPQGPDQALVYVLVPLAILIAESFEALMHAAYREPVLRALALWTLAMGLVVGFGIAAYLAFVLERSPPASIAVAALCVATVAPLVRRSPLPRLASILAAHAFLLIVTLLVYYGSFEPVLAHYAADSEQRRADFDDATWQDRFERRPALRALFQLPASGDD